MRKNQIPKTTWKQLLPLLCILLLASGCKKAKPATAGFGSTGLYVWQTSSTPAVLDACKQAENKTDGFLFYAGNVDIQNNQLALQPNPYNWKAVSVIRKKVTLVYRFTGVVADFLLKKTAAPNACLLATQIKDHWLSVKKTGCDLFEIQLDYDCPAGKLGNYIEFLRVFRQEMQPIRLSITALPDWYNHKKEAKALFDLVDYHVLQVHSLVWPKTRTDHFQIFDVRSYTHYVQQATALQCPFYISLPTYGYELLFDAHGKFTGISAEDSASAILPGYQSVTAMTNPGEIAPIYRQLMKQMPPYCLGVLWFRLPLPTDKRNWPMETLFAVLQGDEPCLSVSVEQKVPSEGLIEIWLQNPGKQAIPYELIISADLHNSAILASDVMNGFRIAEDGKAIIGTVSNGNDSLLVAWFRLKQGIDAKAVSIVTGKAEINK